MVDILPYEPRFRDDMIFMVLEAQDALGLTPKLKPDLLDVEQHYLLKGDGFWLAVEDGRVVGCIGYSSIPGSSEAVLHRLYVKYNRKRQGIGSRLLQTAEDRMRAVGKTAALVHLGGAAYAESHVFYPRRGYQSYAPSRMRKAL